MRLWTVFFYRYTTNVNPLNWKHKHVTRHKRSSIELQAALTKPIKTEPGKHSSSLLVLKPNIPPSKWNLQKLTPTYQNWVDYKTPQALTNDLSCCVPLRPKYPMIVKHQFYGLSGLGNLAILIYPILMFTFCIADSQTAKAANEDFWNIL